MTEKLKEAALAMINAANAMAVAVDVVEGMHKDLAKVTAAIEGLNEQIDVVKEIAEEACENG